MTNYEIDPYSQNDNKFTLDGLNWGSKLEPFY